MSLGAHRVVGFMLLIATASALSAAGNEWGSIRIGSEVINPGEKKKFTFTGERTFEGTFIDFAVFAARGIRPGPTLCVTSAIHGDEINSTEIARRVFAGVDASALSGTLIVLPAINASGFRTMTRYMPDRRDLNRHFPGDANGSVASIVAATVFTGVIRQCTQLIDLHTASNLRTNLPQLRVDTSVPAALDLARHFGVGIIVTGAGPKGSLRREAMRVGIPAIIYEAGPPLIFVVDEIEKGTRGVRNVMAHLDMIAAREPVDPAKLLRDSYWIRVPPGHGGIYLPLVKLGSTVAKGEVLATIADPVTDVVFEIQADQSGVVVGMALPQVVLSGYGLFHVGDAVVAND